MTTEAALLAAVLTAPADDTPRLVLADWWEEHGDETQRARAELVRVQVELERQGRKTPSGCKQLPDTTCSGRNGAIASLGRAWDGPSDPTWCPACAKVVALLEREQDLLDHPLQWKLVPWAPKSWTMTSHAHKPAFRIGANEASQNIWCDLRRGFIERITCTGDDWVRHADAILGTQPVREVKLTTLPYLRVDRRGISLSGRTTVHDEMMFVREDTLDFGFDMVARLLALEWPSIADRFQLPEYGPPPLARAYPAYRTGQLMQSVLYGSPRRG